MRRIREATLWLLLLTACKRYSPPLEAVSQYPTAVGQILLMRCAGCHKGYLATDNHSTSPQSLSSTHALSLTHWDSLFYSPSRETPLIVPYAPMHSTLLWHINSDTTWGPVATPLMPPPLPDSANLLTTAEKNILRAWIAEGAPNAQGKKPWSENEQAPHRKVFVCASGADLIAVYHADNYHLLRYIPVGVSPNRIESPHFIQFSPDHKYFYVTLIAGEAIEKYRTTDYQRVGRLSVGPEPAHIELTPDGRYGVITHFTDTHPVKLTLIDAENMTVLDVLRDPLGEIIARPHGLWIDLAGDFAYVTANAGNYITKVSIDKTQKRFRDFIQIPLVSGEIPRPDSRFGPYQIIGDGQGRYYVSCENSHEVRVFDASTDSFIAAVAVATAPKLMAYHNGFLYVACLKAEAPALQGQRMGAIAVMQTMPLRLLTHLYGLGHLPRGIGVDTRKQQLFISYENLTGADPPHHANSNSTSPGKLYVLSLHSFCPQAIREFAPGGYGLGLVP
ncbi:MAG: hypothetical protein RMK98_03430 [Bacteroidia bacterium]|nr:hypothetical protein [Bacteroidia bacterium]